MEWITNNWTDILAWIGGIITIASIITRLTPSKKDNAVFYKIVIILSKISIFNNAIDAKILEEAKEQDK